MKHQVLGHTLAEALGGTWNDAVYGKGGFWVKGKGFYTLAQARKITGIKAKPRNTTHLLPYGDYHNRNAQRSEVNVYNYS